MSSKVNSVKKGQEVFPIVDEEAREDIGVLQEEIVKKANKEGPLPEYEISIHPSPTIIDFLTANNLNNKTFIFYFYPSTYYPYKATFHSVGGGNYNFYIVGTWGNSIYSGDSVDLTNLHFDDILSSSYRHTIQFEEGPLPSYSFNSNDNVLNFITNNNLVGKAIVLISSRGTYTGGFATQTGTTTYVFEFELVGSNFRYVGQTDMSNMTFYDLFQGTYRKNFEEEDNKVTSISSSSTDTEYPSAKAVYNFSNLIETTWSALKTKRDSSQLIPGRFYRIIDYVTTTIQENTSSAGHQFDVIVLALSNNKLSEEAYAIQHAGNTYFANSKLEAWKLWYCLDNDTNRFAWADTTNGKGVIYRMIDEFGNDCPYDFKNILFTKLGSYTNAYTFSYTEDNAIKDASLLTNKKCYSNIIKEYISNNKLQLNFNVFYPTSVGFQCYENIFSNACHDNTFGNYCRYNTFGRFCSYITFGNYCSSNTFGYYCRYETFGNYCTSNTFGDECYGNTFGNSCSFNTFGNKCSYNKFSEFSDLYVNTNYCRYNILEDGCAYLSINSSDTSATSNNYLQNIHIHLGVAGTNGNRKAITVDRNLSYTTDVYPVGSTEMFV